MKFKSTALLFLLTCFGLSLFAQDSDVLQLQSGTILTGEIVAYIPNDKVIFKKSSDGMTQTYPMEAVAKVQQLPLEVKPDHEWWILVPEVEGNEVISQLQLKDGTEQEGIITSYEPGGEVKLRLESGATITVAESEIESVTYSVSADLTREERREIRKQRPKAAPAPRPKPVYEFRERGWFQNTSFAFSFGRREQEEESIFGPGFNEGTTEMSAIGFNVQHITGFQFNRLVGVGAGVSYDAYDLEDGESVLTLFGHYRAYLSKKIVAPYAAVSAGYGFALLNEDQGVKEADGGWMIHPEVGLRLGATDKANFTVGLGYRLQDAYYVQERPFNGNIEYRNITYQRFLFTLGLLF